MYLYLQSKITAVIRSMSFSIQYCADSTVTITMFLWYTVLCWRHCYSHHISVISVLCWLHCYSHHISVIYSIVLTPLLQSPYFCDIQYCADSTVTVTIFLWYTVLCRRHCYSHHISVIYTVLCWLHWYSHHISVIYSIVLTPLLQSPYFCDIQYCADSTVSHHISVKYSFVLTPLLQSPYFCDIYSIVLTPLL